MTECQATASAVMEPDVNRIRELNDGLRRSLTGGRVVTTAGIAALDQRTVERIIRAVRLHGDFGPDNDPHGEHDFGSIEINGTKAFFKIDYYDKSLSMGSPDPSDPRVTERVLTIMLASEY